MLTDSLSDNGLLVVKMPSQLKSLTAYCRTDFIWARAMGYTGPQLEDSAGVDVGMDGREAQEYR